MYNNDKNNVDNNTSNNMYVYICFLKLVYIYGSTYTCTICVYV